jgi:hypothetical protein
MYIYTQKENAALLCSVVPEEEYESFSNKRPGFLRV